MAVFCHFISPRCLLKYERSGLWWGVASLIGTKPNVAVIMGLFFKTEVTMDMYSKVE